MPEAITAESLSAQASGPLDKWLTQRVAGLSPLAAHEIAFRATGLTDASAAQVNWRAVADTTLHFVGMIDTHAWSPTVGLDAEGRALEYAPYTLTHIHAARLEEYTSISEAMATYYAQAHKAPARRGDPLAAERKALLAPLERAAHSTGRRIAALEHQLSLGTSEREPLRRAGEALLAHQIDIPAGASEVVLDGERIELDPHLSAVENAQAYFARYRKAREAEERVPRLLDEAWHAGQHLADLLTLVEVADQMDAVRALRREVSAATGAQTRRDDRSPRHSAPYRRVSLGDGWEALIGISATGNAAVTFDVGRPEDLWLHARGVPGAHVILRGVGEPSDALVEAAAQLAAGHSAAREASAVEVDVTRRRYVKKVAGGPAGLVTYTHERTIRVPPRA